MQPGYESWPERVGTTFARLKQATGATRQEVQLSLAGTPGYLVPVSMEDVNNAALIADLAAWRTQNMHWYPTQFPVTLESTASWLRSGVLDVSDRIMFLVIDGQGCRVGHLGLANGFKEPGQLKVDNVMRGQANAQPGIMSSAVQTMLGWAEDTLAPQLIYLPVFTDNLHAIAFYRRLGFQDDKVTPLRCHQDGLRTWFSLLEQHDSQPPDRFHLRMIYRPRSSGSSGSARNTAA